jgi:hypothetical protein
VIQASAAAVECTTCHILLDQRRKNYQEMEVATPWREAQTLGATPPLLSKLKDKRLITSLKS